MNFKYTKGDIINNLKILGLGSKSKSGVRLYKVKCLLCSSITDKRLQTVQKAQSCGCKQRKRGYRVPGSGKRAPKGTRVEINTLISIYKSNAKKRDISYSLSYKEFEALVDDKCFFCGDSGCNTLKKKGYNEYLYNGIDRIENGEGYTFENCVTCCGWCNRAKNNGTVYNFIDKCKKIAEKLEMDEGYFNIAKERINKA